MPWSPRLELPRPRPAARFLQQPDRLEVHALLDAFRHVDQGQPGHRCRSERFHLDTGLPGDPRSRQDAPPAANDLEVHRDARQRQRVAERDQLGRLLGRHDAGDPSNLERISLGSSLANRAQSSGRHPHHTFGESLARRRGLCRDVDHPRRALVIQVRESLCHGLQDMRMPDTQGVLFDYGRTLVTFDYPTEALLAVIRHSRPRIASALGVAAPEAQAILEKVLVPMEQYVGSINEDEVDYMSVYRKARAAAGMNLPDGLLHHTLGAAQMSWDRAVKLDPDALQVLSWLGAHGIKRAVCSNAPFPPEMMRRQVK